MCRVKTRCAELFARNTCVRNAVVLFLGHYPRTPGKCRVRMSSIHFAHCFVSESAASAPGGYSVAPAPPAVAMRLNIGGGGYGGVDVAVGVRDQPPVAHTPPELFLAFENKLVLKMPAAPADEILIVKYAEGNAIGAALGFRVNWQPANGRIVDARHYDEAALADEKMYEIEELTPGTAARYLVNATDTQGRTTDGTCDAFLLPRLCVL